MHLILKGRIFVVLLIVSCGTKNHSNVEGPRAELHVAFLDPQLPENKVNSESIYSNMIITVETADVMDEITSIYELKAAMNGEVELLHINDSLQNVTYLLKIRSDLNPLPYYNYIKSYEGVESAAFDGPLAINVE